MVNENFKQFRKSLEKHQGEYIGSDRRQRTEINDPEYNNRRNTDKSPGAAGRDL